MCRIKHKDNPAGNGCTELGPDKREWNKDCLLRPKGDDDPNNQVDEFVKALADLCRDKILDKTKLHALEEAAQHDNFQKWYTKHGSVSGNHRTSITMSKIPKSAPGDNKKISRELLNAVLERDNYCCQYCGCRLIVVEVWEHLIRLSSNYGHNCIKIIKPGNKVRNIEVAGLIFATYPTADHVVARMRGGCTTMKNLVASCFACNYGKDNFKCEELGINNPLCKPKKPIINVDDSAWCGLKDFIGPLASL